jgi:hypothetical protein
MTINNFEFKNNKNKPKTGEVIKRNISIKTNNTIIL